MYELNVANFVGSTSSEGPGRRCALWVQGCLKRCVNCCNPRYLPLVPNRLVPSATVAGWVADVLKQHNVEGITFLGGEPMLQARGLAEVAARCQRAGLSVMVFTGYTMSELDRLRLPGARELLDLTDVLVDGPYLPELPEGERNWVGSTNQRFHYLTTRYGPDIERDERYRPSVEFRIGPAGLLHLNGWPTPLRNTCG
jgi:anaerobic ribonucleoside-triphosphate reductase activating protein